MLRSKHAFSLDCGGCSRKTHKKRVWRVLVYILVNFPCAGLATSSQTHFFVSVLLSSCTKTLDGCQGVATLLLRCASSPKALEIFIVCFTPFVFLVTVCALVVGIFYWLILQVASIRQLVATSDWLYEGVIKPVHSGANGVTAVSIDIYTYVDALLTPVSMGRYR